MVFFLLSYSLPPFFFYLHFPFLPFSFSFPYYKYLFVLLDVLKKLLVENKASRTIIFCNTMGSARSTEYKLREWGYDATILHGEVPPKVINPFFFHFFIFFLSLICLSPLFICFN